MTPPKRPLWPSDDQVREVEIEREFTDDGRKINESERVGGMAPDADPDAPPPRRNEPRPREPDEPDEPNEPARR
jgi:hypothetical protein